MKKAYILAGILLIMGLIAAPVYAQGDSSDSSALDLSAMAMAIAAAGCGYAQSKALTAGCEGMSRNPGASDNIRFLMLLGLAFIEFLALLTFLYVGFF